EDLAEHLRAVAQRPVPNQESVKALLQVTPVRSRKAGDDQRRPRFVTAPAPERSGLHHAHRRRTLDLGEGPALVLAIVEADAREGPEASAELLVGAGGESRLGAPVGARLGDVHVPLDRLV